MSHGRDAPKIAASVARAALLAVDKLDEEHARLYADLVLSRLGEAARAALEAMMESGRYEYQSDFAKKYIALGRSEGKAEGDVEGRSKGKAEGKAEGRSEGKAEGRTEGKAEAVVAILVARGVVVPAEARERILASRDLAEIDGWVARVAIVASTDELFANTQS